MAWPTREKQAYLTKLREGLKEGEKLCPSCETVKPVTEFHKNKNTKDGTSSYCKVCNIKRAKDHGKSEAGRSCRLKRQHGITSEQYAEILKAQGGGCKICGSKQSNGRWDHLHVDHCHRSGKVRGILCNKCNTMLGHVDDSVETLLSAARYLEDSR